MTSILLKKNYEEYLISNMKRVHQADSPMRAKTWMLTAKSLFPSDFFVQYEAYKMEKNLKNTKQSSCYFTELMKKFPNESGMLMEMQRLTEALRTKVKNEDTFFLRKMFKNLPNDTKYKVLSTVANHCKEPMEHCCLMLLLLQELPSQLFQHGEKVIETLLLAETHSHCNHHPVNAFRSLLVCKALPIILFAPNFRLPPKLLFRLLQVAFEFFICYIFTLPEQDLDTDILRMCKEESWMSTKGLHNAWKSLFVLIKTVGQQLHWTLSELFSSRINLIFEMNWEKILSMIRMKLFADVGDHGSLLGASYESSPHDKEVFFCTVAIFFYALHQFSKVVGPKFYMKSKSESSHIILVEGIRSFTDDDNSESVSKKFKYDRDKKLEKNTSITVSKSVQSDVGENLTESFVVAVRVWDLIQRNYSLSNEFSRLCEVAKINEWPCFEEFFVDMLIYQGCHKDAIAHLTHVQGNTKDEFIKNKTCLQLASCLNYIGEHVTACNYLFDAISSFTNTSTSNVDIQIPPPRSHHHLYFLVYGLDEILHFCIEFLIVIYKKKIKMSDHDGVVLGHLLILSQYTWPREEELFLQCVKQIKHNGSFCFAKFFEYVINPGILEEFMFLTTPSGGSVALDLLPSSTMQVGKQRAITRGVNKGAKDDFRDAMRKQMARCNENINDLFVKFLRQERHFIKMIIG